LEDVKQSNKLPKSGSTITDLFSFIHLISRKM